jgi:Cytochrome c554 and c-prime
MAAILERKPAMIGLAGMVVLCSSVAVSSGGGQAPRDRQILPGSAKLTPYIYGARHCAACHDQEQHDNMRRNEIDGLICRMIEFPIYEKQDQHTQAFKALTGSRAAAMTRLLGYDVTRSDACLNCHSTAEQGKGKQFFDREADGVTCVACHGASAEWVEVHQRTDQSGWRGLDRRTKQDRYGMIDLWDPVRRAETCASCHIGSHSDGKVVTHAMYAAGHPPLPGFEAATFSEAEPRHWQYVGEKLQTPERAKRLNPAPNPRNLEQSQLVVLGGLVAFRESMKLFADPAAPDERPDTAETFAPDFARFDCAACHHDLRADNGASSRQLRRRGGAPGRPVPPEWPLILVRLGIEATEPTQAASQEEQLQLGLGAFQQGLKARPFGDPHRTGPAARSLVRWTDSLLERLDRTLVDAAKARQLLLVLSKMARDNISDYDSARQIAWAFRIIYYESVPDPKRDSVVDKILTELAVDLSLDLSPSQERTPIESCLSQRLKISADFDPRAFKKKFAEIEARLAAMAPVQEASR